MKFDYAPSEAYGWAEIGASPTDFDAYPPLQAMRVLWPLGDANVDRVAVASSLIFSPWIAGHCDYVRPFSALTEQRIAEWFQTHKIWASPGPIRSGGLQIPRGHRKVLLGEANEVGTEETPRLQFVGPLEGSGQKGNDLQVACNLATLSQDVPNVADRFAMRVGLAVLVAEPLSISELVYPEFAASSPVAFSAVARLVECVSLGLRND